jgi:hypothetical protein
MDKDMMLPNSFHKLGTPLPPMLCDMAGVRSEARYIAFYYQGSKASWTDGRASGTFSFYDVWKPLTDHRAIALPLALSSPGAHLGYDDDGPTHGLVADRLDRALFLAPYEAVWTFLDDRYPAMELRSLSAEEWAAVKALAEALPEPSLEELRQQGMFEWFSAPSEERITQSKALIRWLDLNIDPVLENAYQKAVRMAFEND